MENISQMKILIFFGNEKKILMKILNFLKNGKYFFNENFNFF